MSTYNRTHKRPSITCYVAGSSGGHIIPCLTMAREEQEKHPERTCLFFTTDQPMDIELVSGAPCVDWHITLPLKKASATSFGQYLRLTWRAAWSFLKAGWYLMRHRPDTIICTGGFIALPVVIWGRILAIPIEWHELNVQPGKATQWVAQWRLHIHTPFEQTQSYLPQSTCVPSNYPIRFFNVPQLSKKEACIQLKLEPSRKTICILGGSQGSIAINNLIRTWLITHPWVQTQVQIIHQTGRNDPTNWHALYKQHGIPAVVCSFSHTLELFYAAADVVVSRAGAGSLFETLFFNIPAIVIPLETKENQHQVANALAMQETYDDIFTVIRQAELKEDPERLHYALVERLSLHMEQTLAPTENIQAEN